MSNNKCVIEMIKTRPNKTSRRAHPMDAGLDIYTPDDMKPMTVRCGEIFTIDTGLHFNLPKGTMMYMCNKTGISKNLGLQVMAKVVDEGFIGELTVCMRNSGKKRVVIEPGMKIMQGVIVPVLYPTYKEVKQFKLSKAKKEDRGEGKFGSTGIK